MKKRVLLLILLLLGTAWFIVHIFTSKSSVHFTVGDQSFTYTASPTATVLAGAYEGLALGFYDTESSEASLNFEWPSSETFGIGNRPAEFSYHTPDLPFTLTDETFAGLYSERLQSAVTPVLRWKQSLFADFEIQIDSFQIDKKTITISGSFSGSTIETNPQKIAGEFTMQNIPLVVMHIE